jgi:hypothetical protein
MATASKTQSKTKSKSQSKAQLKTKAVTGKKSAASKSGSTKSGTTKRGSTKRGATRNGTSKAAATALARSGRKSTRNGFHPGTYTVPRGHVSIAVPPFWYLHQTNDDIQVESEASETTVIVSAYQRKRGIGPLDARDYLQHFLETAPVRSRLESGGTRRDAGARFRDPEGDNWLVRFLSNGDTLVLATCHSNRPLTSREGKTGAAVLASVKLKARG